MLWRVNKMHFGEACGAPRSSQFFSKHLVVQHNERKCEAALLKGHQA